MAFKPNDSSDEEFEEYVTPNFEDDFSDCSSPRDWLDTIERRELNIEKFAKSSRFDQFKTVSRARSKKNFDRQSQPQSVDRRKNLSNDKLLETPAVNKVFYKGHPKVENTKADRHLDSNTRRRHSLWRGKKNIDTIFDQLKNHEEEEPESVDDSLAGRSTSQVYLKYKAMFDGEDGNKGANVKPRTVEKENNDRVGRLHNYRSYTIE